MRRSITERWLYRLVLIPLAVLGARGAFAQFSISGPARLVNVIEVNDHEDQVDLTVVFNCSMRFVTSLPASEGKQVHIQLAPMPDCGVSPLSQLLAETPPVSGGANILMGDGSVHFLKDSIAPAVLWAIGSTAQGEVISADSY